MTYIARDLTGRLLGLSLGESISQLKHKFPLNWLNHSLAEAFLRALSEQALLFDWPINHMHLGRRNMVWPWQALLFHLEHCLCVLISISHCMDLNLAAMVQYSLDASLSYIKQTVNGPCCGLLIHSERELNGVLLREQVECLFMWVQDHTFPLTD